ncbi:DNA ligase 1-like [Drosophila tropicalis]|uniref:DNA ligase 1-like n=1 Tax=Drosophila tropicalis TaxID=46794 RepID=UPI0035ABDB63
MDTKKKSFQTEYKDKDKDNKNNNVANAEGDGYKDDDDDDNYTDIDDDEGDVAYAIDDKFRIYRENLRRHRQKFAKYEKERREISQTLNEIVKEVRTLRSEIDELEMTVSEVYPIRQDNEDETLDEVIETTETADNYNMEDNINVDDYEYDDNDEDVANNIENKSQLKQPEAMQSEKKTSKISQLLDGQNKHSCILS